MALSETQFIVKHRSFARRLANHFWGLLEPDDLYACADIGLLTAARRYDGVSDLSKYIWYRVRDAILTEVRRERGRPEVGTYKVGLVPTEDEFLDRPAPDFDIAVFVDWKTAMDRLSPRLRGIVAARSVGVPQAEIGRALNMSEARVCQLEKKARGLLRAGGVS